MCVYAVCMSVHTFGAVMCIFVCMNFNVLVSVTWS